jgi:hypothetical protein
MMLVAIAHSLEPSHMLRKGNIFMTKDAAADELNNAARANSMPPARDPDAAVAEEYQAAQRTGTAEAFELFIARHTDCALAETARGDLRRLRR